ncbi:hypothetical protein Dsin_019913 [Dipteronia sinensis]|uniref:Core Histone H2A/H2B/H3 domain-containing protein n=1 Tax=Dipteronia sinensis TaxID=43782 RepID=A0AAE0A8N1_9ROSI|nr:hypothetical protein Dsin_019913 [Dipteronia sinensis]
MPPKRSAKVVVSRKFVQEIVEVSVVQTNNKGNKVSTSTHDEEEEPPLKTNITVEGKEQEHVVSVQVQVEEPVPEDEQEQETSDISLEPESQTPTKRKQPEQESMETHKGTETEKKKKKRKRGNEIGGEGYKIYVFRVLKEVHPGMTISSKAMMVINNLMSDMFERIASEATLLSKCHKRTTLSSREIQGAVKLVLPGEIAKHAVAEGTKAVTNYMSYQLNNPNPNPDFSSQLF